MENNQTSVQPTRVIKDGGGFHEFKRNCSVADFPNGFPAYLKSFGDLYFWKKGNFHVITKAEHAKQVLMSKDFSADRASFFISRMPNMDLNLIKDFFQVVKHMMVMSDDKDHTRRRKAAQVGFDESVLTRFKSKMKMTVDNLIKDIEGLDQFDFHNKIAKNLPSSILADLFSIPEEDRFHFLKWSNIMTGFFGGASQYRNEDGIEVNSAAIALRDYFHKLIDERSARPQDDYVSLVIKSSRELGLNQDELTSQLIMMLVAGMATTTDQINNIMYLLAANPEIQKQVRQDRTLIAPMIEELKRFDPAVTFIFRVARAKTQIGNQPIEPGDVIFISTHAINRDLPESEAPNSLNIHRSASHYAYGHGAHYCIGARLARMEMNQLFDALLERLPLLVLDPNQASERDHYSASFSGFKKLPLQTVR